MITSLRCIMLKSHDRYLEQGKDPLCYNVGHANLLTIGKCQSVFWFNWKDIPIAVVVSQSGAAAYHLISGKAPNCTPVDSCDPEYHKATSVANWYVDAHLRERSESPASWRR